VRANNMNSKANFWARGNYNWSTHADEMNYNCNKGEIRIRL
jgi:hypothetical protein